MPITPTLQTHDILLTDYAGTPVTLGLIIEKDKNGIPIFRRQPADSLSQQQFQEFSAAMFPPQYQGFITQNTWHGGFGKQSLTGRGGDNQYLQTHGVDKSVKGLSFPSPVPVATTNTTATYTDPTITNGGIETGDLTGWTVIVEGDGVPWQAQTTTVRTGTYALKMRRTDNTAVLSQSIPGNIPLVEGNTLVFSGYARVASSTGSCRLVLQDDIGNTLATGATIAPTATGWTEMTVSYLVTSATVGMKLRIEVLTTLESYFDDITISGAAITTSTAPNAVTKLVDFNNASYLVSDSGVWKRTAANWARVANSPPNIVDAVSDGTNLYLATGISKNAWYMNTSESFTAIVQSNSRCSKLAWINGSMYGTTSATNLRKFTDITAGTVAANYTVNRTGYNITALVNHTELPFVVGENWAGYVNSAGTVIPIAEELFSMFNANTGKNSISWRGNGAQTLYIPAGAGASMLAYDDGDVVNMGPDVFAERLADFVGQIVATYSDDQWLYIVLDNSTKIEIFKGRYETIGGSTDFRWHPIVEDTYTTVGYAFITSITAKRLYYGGGTALPKYIPLSTQYGNPLGDTGLTFNTAVTDETPWYDLNLPRISKSYLNFTIDSTGLTANITITVEYQLWESQGTWTELGGSGNGVFNTSPTQTKTFAINIAGRKIRFRFTYTTNNTATAYGMYEYTARLALAPKRLNIYTTTVRVGSKNNIKGTGEKDTEMVYSKVAPQLQTWKDTQPLLITFPDGQFNASDGTHDGATEEVKFMEGYPKEIPVDLGEYVPVRQDPESLFQLALVSIDRSVS